MPRFGYVAYDATGSTHRGTISGPDTTRASNVLASRGLTVVEITPRRLSLDTRIEWRRTLRTRDVALIVRNLANTQLTGVPTFKAVAMLAEQFRNSAAGDVLADIETDVANGATLGEAFRNQQERVGELSCAMIEAGEATGQLDRALLRLAQILEGQARLRRKVLSAASYPIFALVLSLAVFVGMMLFVVPVFENIYRDFGVELPLITDVMLGTTRTVARMAWAPPLLLAAAVFGYWRAMKVKQVRLRRDRLLLRLPVVGGIVRAANMSRVMSTVASTLGAGVPLLHGLTVGANVAENLEFTQALERVRENVRDGRTLHAALTNETVFPPMLSRVVETGEEAGSLATMLERYAEVVADDTQTAIETATAFIEPLLLVAVGIVVGLALAALYLPLFNLSGIV